MDEGFFGTIQGFKITSRKLREADDDFFDRLNHYHSSLILIVLSIIICARQYVVGEPLQCWVPVEFSGAWEQYAENYCWVENTYWIPHAKPLPRHSHVRAKAEIQYYQWVPFVLALQALLFYVPCVFWRLLHFRSGVEIKTLVQKACDVENVHPDHREKNLDVLTRHMRFTLGQIRVQRGGLVLAIKRVIFSVLFCGNSKRGNYLVSLYLVTKVLYILAVVAQFAVTNIFLGTKYHFFGIQVLKDLGNGFGWEHTGHFPRVTYCDFNISTLGNIRPYTLQCVLVINLLNEKIYIFLWFWFLWMLVANIASFLQWFWWTVIPNRQVASIASHFKGDQSVEREDIENFVNHLTSDGVFLLRLIGENSGSIVHHNIVQRLFANFMEDDRRRRETEGGTPLVDMRS